MSVLTSPAAWTTAAVVAALCYQAFQLSTLAGPRRRPPGPRGNQVLRFRKHALDGTLHELVYSWAEQYGDFFCFKVVDNWFYFTTDATVARTVLRDTDTFIRLFGLTRAGDEIGPILFAIDGPVWKLHRKIISPAFTPGHLRRSLTELLRLTDRMCSQIDAAIEAASGDWSASIDMHAVFSRLTLDVFATAFLGNDINALGSGDSTYTRAADGCVAGLNNRLALPKWLWPILVRDDFYPSIDRLRDLVYSTINAKLNAAQESQDTKSKQEMDLLDILLHASGQDGEALSVDDLASEMIGFLMAGYETTANSTTFAFKRLHDHPEQVALLRQEMNEVVGNQTLTTDLIGSLKHLDLFVKEVLRFHPAVEFNLRSTTKPTTLKGYTIPKGASVHMIGSRLQCNPAYWRDPETFNPARFETDDIVPGSYLPFGDGPHKCIGERLGLLEMKVIIIALLQRHEFRLPSDQPFKLLFAVTLGYKDGLFARFRHIK
ncbi:hypothetical protein RI367_007087 [Sorochytrium milnesiophthora]